MEPGEEYEYLPTDSVTTHLMAGAMAGVMEHCAMYPIDSIKTKMQSLNPSAQGLYRSIIQSFQSVSAKQGVLSTYRGINAVAMGAGPAHALYFSTYEFLKKSIGGASSLPDTHMLVSGTAGLVATLVHDGFMNPFDVIKQRLQMHNSPYAGVRDCITTVYRQEGFRAFYRSYATQLSMNVPFQTIHFTLYENITNLLNPNGAYDPRTHVIAGALSGGLAAAATTPLDVLKTVLNTQDARLAGRKTEVKGMVDAARTVYSLQGVGGFWRGMNARMLYHMPSTAICWSVYEFFKHFITEYRADTDNGDPASINTSVSASAPSHGSPNTGGITNQMVAPA